MIAIESIKQFRLRDIIAITLFSLVASGLSYLISTYISSQPTYVLSLLSLITIMALTIHIVKKAFSVTLFFFLTALLTLNINDIGPTGLTKIAVYVLAGIVFELTFLIFKLEFKNIQMDIVLGAMLAAASIPITTALMLSPTMTLNNFLIMLNLILLSVFVGLGASIIAFIVWFRIKTKKIIMQFEYH